MAMFNSFLYVYQRVNQPFGDGLDMIQAIKGLWFGEWFIGLFPWENPQFQPWHHVSLPKSCGATWPEKAWPDDPAMTVMLPGICICMCMLETQIRRTQIRSYIHIYSHIHRISHNFTYIHIRPFTVWLPSGAAKWFRPLAPLVGEIMNPPPCPDCSPSPASGASGGSGASGASGASGGFHLTFLGGTCNALSFLR